MAEKLVEKFIVGKEETKDMENCFVLPEGKFCSGNCSDGCIYWNPYDRDSNGRQYCSWYNSYFYPRERNGCLSKKS